MAKILKDFKALTFDCYGTLIDWESGIWDSLQPLIMSNRGAEVGRRQALEIFGEVEHAQQKATPDMPYPDLLTRVHGAMADRLALRSSDALDAEFGRSITNWPAFPDSAEALRYLKSRYRLVILSNVSRDGFAVSNRKLGVEFDAIYTAEDIGSYKPDAANFVYLLEHLDTDLGLAMQDILHTAQSLLHDHAPARRIGLANAWIDRQRLSESGDWGATLPISGMPEIDFRFFTMGEMAEAVRADA